MSPGQPKLFPSILFISFVLAGCGSGSNPAPAPNPVFSSSPVMTADEGTIYSYRLTATSADGAAVTFALTSGSTGASLSGDTLSWTPTHEQSRTANAFTVTASTARGGSTAQSWNVTPDGTIQIKAVTTYWTSTGKVDVPRVWLAGQAYRAVLAPQADGSLSRLQGSANPDGTFAIPDVPAGFYWLQISPTATYWTSTSTFDAGFDVAGNPLKLTAPSPATLNLTLIGLDSGQNDLIDPIRYAGF